MARPRNQEGRRRQLVAATAAAIADRGLPGLRLKDIAERAGMSVGSVLYYYPDLDALLVEVHEQVLQQFYWARVEATSTVEAAVHRLRIAVEHGIPDATDDPTVRTIYELHVASARDSSHAALLTQLWEREVSLYERILQDGVDSGSFPLQGTAREVAETTVALEDAFDLHLAGRNAAVSRSAAIDRVLAYLEAVTGASLRASAHRDGAV